MAPLIATACIVFLVAALSVYGPGTRSPKAGAHLRDGGSSSVPVPPAQLGNDPVSKLVGVLRRRPWARFLLTTASIGLLVGAIGTIGYPFYTNLLQDRIQSRLDRQFNSDELRQQYLDRNVKVGDSLTRIQIPELDVDVVVVEGITASALRAGAGHYPGTPLPCEEGNVAIAGHRTTYGRPFHSVHQLEMGDEITLVTPIGPCTYRVSEKPFTVSPKEISVVANTPDTPMLTLTTCHPIGSAKERLIIRAELVSSQVRTAA
ncbi:MAG: class E sortase [Acidimicrobiales bacterium]|nr:class E sortase [Acidimicrobiales bacterium]